LTTWKTTGKGCKRVDEEEKKTRGKKPETETKANIFPIIKTELNELEPPKPQTRSNPPPVVHTTQGNNGKKS